MVSASMATQDESGSTDSETTLPLGNQVAFDEDVSSMKSIHLKEQFHSGGDHALKVRKPYTITKQRERWTEEEHKKFLEALKLYGRAWRRIEEHVGTKTAVQIRSHAQKFFTKVVRESNNGDSASVKPIEIPPPRPKRKPLHPYPRKLSTSTKAAALLLKKPACSVAPDTTEDNQSPTSVLSAIGSDASGATDSNTPDGSLSRVSSVIGGSAGYVLSDPQKLPPREGNTSPWSSQVNNSSHRDWRSPKKLDLFPEENSFVEEGSVEVSSTQCLKLFGKTVLVTDSCRPSSPIAGACKMQASNESEGKLVQTLHWNFIPINCSPCDLECSWSALPFGARTAPFCLPLQNGRSNPSEHPSHFFPFVKVHSPTPVKASSLFGDFKEMPESEIRNDGSSSNSNAESQFVEADSGPEAQSCRLFLGKEETASSSPSHASISKQRSSSCKRTKGFVPYKRCLSDRDARSVVVGEEREEQRIRLCL